MNVPAHMRERVLAEGRLRQQEIISWELTYVQIMSLPETTDCPPEELV